MIHDRNIVLNWKSEKPQAETKKREVGILYLVFILHDCVPPKTKKQSNNTLAYKEQFV